MSRLFLFAFSLVLSGCVIFPGTTPVAPELSGRVIDARTGLGVPGASIVAQRADFTRQVLSRPDGSYTVPSIRQWHYLWYLGSPGAVPPPWWTVHSHMSPYEISVEKPGYARQGISFVPHDERRAFWDFPLRPSPPR